MVARELVRFKYNYVYLYRSINGFKKGYQHRTNTVKDKKSDWVTGSHSILTTWRNHFSQLLNVHEVNDVRQVDIHTVEPPVSEPSAFEIEVAIEKLKRHKSPGTDQISAKLMKARGRTIHSEIHNLKNPTWNKEELLEQWQESITVSICKRNGKTDCSNYRGITNLSTTFKVLSNILLSRLTPYAEDIIEDHWNGFQCIYSAFFRKNGNIKK